MKDDSLFLFDFLRMLDFGFNVKLKARKLKQPVWKHIDKFYPLSIKSSIPAIRYSITQAKNKKSGIRSEICLFLNQMLRENKQLTVFTNRIMQSI